MLKSAASHAIYGNLRWNVTEILRLLTVGLTGMTIPPQRILSTFDAGTSLGQLIDEITHRLAGGKLWYRGESREFPHPGLPHFARNPPTPLTPLESDFVYGGRTLKLRATTKEEQQVILRFQAAPPSDPYFFKLVNSQYDPAWLALARHHGHPTRLLDVSSDVRVATYFACSENPTQDGFLLAYVNVWNPEANRRQPANHYADLLDAALGDAVPAYREAERSTPGTLAQHFDMLEKSIPPRYDNIVYLFKCATALNQRMNAQRGAFLWRGDPLRDLVTNVNMFFFRIKANAKARLLQDLDVQGTSANSLCL